MEDVVEKFRKDADEIVQRSLKESDERLKKMQDVVDKGDKASIDNFKEWRSYLHKFYVLILAIVGATGVLNGINKIDSPSLIWGVNLSLGGLIIGFLIINLYFYFERKWTQISYLIEQTNPYQFYNHPDVENDIALAMKLNIGKMIKDSKEELKSTTDPKRIRSLKQRIKGDKTFIRLLKYLGQQHGFIERLWLFGVATSLMSCLAGLLLILNALVTQ